MIVMHALLCDICANVTLNSALCVEEKKKKKCVELKPVCCVVHGYSRMTVGPAHTTLDICLSAVLTGRF